MGDSQNRTGKIVRWTVVVAIVALVAATVTGWLTAAYRVISIAPAGSLQVNVEKSFPADGVKEVEIKGVSETIHITQSEDGRFKVRLSGTAATADREAVPQLEAEKSGSTLDVVVRHRPGISLGLHGAELLLEVSVPKSYSGTAVVQSVSGSIDAEPQSYARFTAMTTSGEINLNALRTASLSVRSVSGAVTAQGLEADSAKLENTSGSIRVSGAIPVIRIGTVSGAVTARTSTAPTRIEAGSTSGSIKISLPASSRFDLDARSTSGAINCAFPILVSRQGGAGRHELAGSVGTVGGGGAARAGEIVLRTTSGSISVSKQ